MVDNNNDSDDDCYSNEHDCEGVCDGIAWESDCGCVAADNSGDDCDDCFDVPDGEDFDQGCGCGVYDQLPTDGCDDICGSTLELDECDVCDGDNSLSLIHI